MSFADAKFFPAVFVAASGRRRGLPEERISEGMRRLKEHLSELEARLEGREYLAGSFSLADVAYAGNFVRLRELAEGGELSFEEWPRVASWMERIESRESYEKSL
nr:glutathione S-transferase domain-containing protein [Rubrobacter naiadicus]